MEIPRAPLSEGPQLPPERYGIPDSDWAVLLKSAGASEGRVSALVKATKLIADTWARELLAPSPVSEEIDEAGRAALVALQKGFEYLAKSRSHEEMRSVLQRISPHWRRDTFHIPGVEEHEIAWPGDLAFEISEFLGLKAEGRPPVDSEPNRNAAESLIKAWKHHLRKPANFVDGPGSIRWFYEVLLIHIQPELTPADVPMRLTGPRKRQERVKRSQLPSFRAEMKLALERALKRQQSMTRTPRGRKAGRLLVDVTAADIVE